MSKTSFFCELSQTKGENWLGTFGIRAKKVFFWNFLKYKEIQNDWKAYLKNSNFWKTSSK